MRGSTQLSIMRLLRRQNQLSRADLASHLNMHRGNITRATADMLGKNWIRECRGRKKTGGRGQPPVLLEINGDVFSTIGISISSRIDLAILNGNGEILKTHSFVNTFRRDPELTISRILEKIDAFLADSSALNLGIGISTSGSFTRDEELLYDNYYLGSSANRSRLQEHLEYISAGPVIMDLIANVYPLAEYQSRFELRDNKTFFCITDRLDLGGIWDGKMISDHSRRKLSIKHMKIRGVNEQCICSKPGCLLMAASLWSMSDRLHGFSPGSRGIQPYERMEQERQELFSLIESNDPRVRPMVEQATEAIYEASENLAVIFQPDAIFFDHWLSILPEIGINRIRQNFEDYTRAMDKPMFTVDINSHGQYQGAIGSAIMILESSFGQISSHRRLAEFENALQD